MVYNWFNIGPHRQNLKCRHFQVSSPTDTSNFDVDDNDIRVSDAQPPSHNPAFSGLHLPFVGFSFTQGSNLSDSGQLGLQVNPFRSFEVSQGQTLQILVSQGQTFQIQVSQCRIFQICRSVRVESFRFRSFRVESFRFRSVRVEFFRFRSVRVESFKFT